MSKIKCPSCGELTEKEYINDYHGESMCEGCAQATADRQDYPLDHVYLDEQTALSQRY